MISVGPADVAQKIFNIAILSDTIRVINVKLCTVPRPSPVQTTLSIRCVVVWLYGCMVWLYGCMVWLYGMVVWYGCMVKDHAPYPSCDSDMCLREKLMQGFFHWFCI